MVEYGSSVVWFSTALVLFLVALFQAARVSTAFSDAMVSLLVHLLRVSFPVKIICSRTPDNSHFVKHALYIFISLTRQDDSNEVLCHEQLHGRHAWLMQV